MEKFMFVALSHSNAPSVDRLREMKIQRRVVAELLRDAMPHTSSIKYVVSLSKPCITLFELGDPRIMINELETATYK